MVGSRSKTECVARCKVGYLPLSLSLSLSKKVLYIYIYKTFLSYMHI